MDKMTVENLTRDYGNGKGVFNLSFSIAEGEIFGFLGPNGAGKTTTIRHLTGFLRPQSGSCSICGYDCRKESKMIQARLGYIPGEISFFDDMTGDAFLQFIKKYRGLRYPDRSKELLERFELDPKGKIRKMSKGMKQKIGIVAAFMHDPEILILDEPTSGLDPLMQNRFITLLEEERKKGKTILLSSHIFEEVERTCHRVAIIRAGHLVAADSVASLKASQTKKFILTFSSERESERFASAASNNLQRNGNRIEIAVHRNFKKFLKMLSQYDITDLSEVNQSLEEIFMQYYGEVQNAE